MRAPRPNRGIPLRALAPNAITAAAMCFGLSGIRFAISGEWERSIVMILIAGLLVWRPTSRLSLDRALWRD